MNQKIKRGRENLLLLILFFLITILQSTLVTSACCTNPSNYCQDVSAPQECCGQINCDAGIYEEAPCTETKCEWMGCCLQTCEMTQKKDCNYAFTYINDLEPTYDCGSAPECLSGCCVYLTSENNIGFCEVKPQLDCEAYELYPNTQFHTGMTEGECSQLCSIGQMMTGSLMGKIIDNQTNAPIPNSQIIVAGISSFTNIYGEFFLEEAPIGTPFIEISATGYTPISLNNIQINYNETTSINFSLAPTVLNTGTLTGYVRDEIGIPLLAYVYWDGGGSFTTIAGRYTLIDVLQGSQEITAIADNYQTKKDPVEVEANIINTHNFSLIGISPEELCGNNQIDIGEQCDGNSANTCPGLCGSDCLCPNSCMEAEGECYTWSHQCTAVSGSQLTIEGIDLCAASNYAGSSYGCCDIPIVPIPPCINGEQTNEPISSTDLTSASGKICQCGSQYLDIDDIEISWGYCCSNIYHQSNNPCIAFGTFTGYILDSNTTKGIKSATIKLTNLGTTEELSTSTIYNGNYLIDVRAGSYSLLVTKQGYAYNSTTLNILPSEIQNNNITLDPIFIECSETSFPESTGFLLQTQGTKDIELFWQHPCTEFVDRFEIYRNNQHLFTNSEIQQSSEPVLIYTDSTTEWDTQYEYYVTVYSTYNQQGTSSSIIINTGSEECDGKFGDESWCIDSTKRVVCNEENQPVLWDGNIRNSPNGDCSFAQGNNSFCQMEGNATWCTLSDQECTRTGLEQGNIFGLYYNLYYELNELGCLEDRSQPSQLQQRFCYYDSYQDFWTTIDQCFNCDTDTSCYDYKTEDACILDNCYAGPRNNAECDWYSTPSYFEILGKGICYQTNYQGTDRCNLCSQERDLFENAACSFDICSKLGRCYSNLDESSCLSCEVSTSCKSYTTKQECLGESNIEFSKGPGVCGSNRELIYSQDNCNLGRCDWINNHCVKDGNADNLDDCLESESCLRDNIAPSTFIENKPAYINKEGNILSFSTVGSANEIYYCLEQDCCPSTLIENGTLFLSGEIPSLTNREETMEISYYSVDINRNIEQIQTSDLFIDTILPDMQISYEITNSSFSDTQSDMAITITVTEKSICQDSLMPALTSKLTNALISDNASVNYQNLEDGNYLYTVTCNDIYQNKLTKNWNIRIDRIQKIFDESPDMQTLQDSEVIISLKTTDPLYCYYRTQSADCITSDCYTLPISFNLGQIGIEVAEGEFYYEATLSGLSSDTYINEVICQDTQLQGSYGNIIDTSLITFTIDQLVPETTLTVLLPNGTFVEPQLTPYALLTIKLDCIDQIQGPPQESGCISTKYCLSYIECEPNTFYTQPKTLSVDSGTYFLCYSSTDLFGNTAQTSCNQFLIDNNPPSLSITNPIEMGLISITPYTIEGLWNDTSSVDIYIKAENQYGALTESVLANITMNGSIGQFSGVLDLFEGYNKIIATAYDVLGNTVTKSINSYLDLVPPTISSFILYDDYSPNNPDNDHFLEYGQNIMFEIIANDDMWADVNNEKTTDITKIEVTISCKQDTGCFNQDIILEIIPGDTTETYIGIYNPIEQEILLEGEYIANLKVEDQMGNSGYLEDIFSIIDSIEFTPEIHNHLNKRIDALLNDAEFNHPITFLFDSTKRNLINLVYVKILHEVPSLYNTQIELNNLTNFTYTLTDQLPLGIYNINYTIKDLFGETYYYLQQFKVDDTVPPSFSITITKEGIATDSVGYGMYNVIIESNEPLLSIDTLNYTINGNIASIYDITGSGSIWYGNLYIAPAAIYANLDSIIATFNIESQDINQMMGTEITFGKTFTINTMGPGPPPII